VLYIPVNGVDEREQKGKKQKEKTMKENQRPTAMVADCFDRGEIGLFRGTAEERNARFLLCQSSQAGRSLTLKAFLV
jgi:hypothetical protein